MKICVRCGHPNKDEAKFCGACGSTLDAPAPPAAAEQKPAETLCPVCGSKNRPGVHFCGYCGANLSQAAEGAPSVPSTTGAHPVDAEGPAGRGSPVAAGEHAALEADEPAPAAPPPADASKPSDTSPTTIVEPVAAAQAPSGPKPVATCSHCGTVIRYCPCCGQPLFEGELSLVPA